MKRTAPSETLAEEFSLIWAELRRIQTSMSKRILPVGYRWTVDGSGDLIVVRETDSVSTTIIS